MTILTLIQKDLTILLRDRSVLVLALFSALLLSVIAAAGITQSFLPAHQVVKVFPTILWIGFLSSAALALPQLHAVEERERVGEGILLAGVKPESIFLSKLFVGVAVALLSFLVVTVVLGLLLRVPVFKAFGPLLLIGGCTSIAYVALATLLSVIAVRSQLGGVLLPVLVLPLAIPLFLVSVEGTIALLVEGRFSMREGWFGLLLLMTFVYTGAGLLLYPRMCRE